MEMMQYRPWEKNEVNEIISKLQDGQLPILDIQLGGSCCNKCIYCDTPKYGEPCKVNLDAIKKILDSEDIKGVYICGLGEPTHGENLEYLMQILEWCQEKGIWLSMFTNLMYLDDKLLNYIENGTLNILFKYDTKSYMMAKTLYGQANQTKISQYFENISKLEKIAHAKNGITSIGASIVPTSFNYSELPEIIDYCIENGFFPLIGQLENAGTCSEKFENMKLTDEQLIKIRDYMLQKYSIDYQMPTCPATISGIHVTNRNKVILDKRTGLSCPWFWLDEPQLEVIGDINEMNYDEIVQKILEYRASRYDDVCRMHDNIESYPFGGCGGDVKNLLETYIEIYQSKE